MRLAGRLTTFFLSEDGKEFFQKFAGVEPLDVVSADVEETDDVGVWIRMRRGTTAVVLLLRWEFILGIELRVDSDKVVGLKG